MFLKSVCLLLLNARMLLHGFKARQIYFYWRYFSCGSTFFFLSVVHVCTRILPCCLSLGSELLVKSCSFDFVVFELLAAQHGAF